MKKILLLALIFVSCKAQKEVSSEEEEKTYIIVDGNHIEMVADEFGNQYLKQYSSENMPIYIPFPFETESAQDSLNSLHAKIPTHDQ